jgi:hypothetical protein
LRSRRLTSLACRQAANSLGRELAVAKMVVAPVLQTTLEAHAGVVTAVEYINDDDVFITSSMDCSFAVWQRRGSGM